MKLAKLSLAAMMVAGALSTTASAQPLEDAIKGVEFSGMLRYRLNMKEDGTTDNSTSENDFDFLGKFTTPVTDNMKAVFAFASASEAGNNKGNGLPSDNDDTTDGVDVDLRKVFLVYNQDALTVKAGMQALALPTTDNGFNGNKATGVLAMYNAGVATFAGAYFSGMNATGSSGYSASSDELMAAAVIGSMGPVNAQLWYAKTQELIDAWIMADVSASFAGLTLQGQAISTEINNDTAVALYGANADDSGMFYAVKAGYGIENFKFNAGMTQTDDDQPIHGLEEDVNTNVISGGWRLTDDGSDWVADQRVIFVDAGATFGKFGATIGYADAKVDSANNSDASEVWGQVSYKYAKNFNTYVKYSKVSVDDDRNTNFGGAAVGGDNLGDDNEYIRFEAKYTF